MERLRCRGIGEILRIEPIVVETGTKVREMVIIMRAALITKMTHEFTKLVVEVIFKAANHLEVVPLGHFFAYVSRLDFDADLPAFVSVVAGPVCRTYTVFRCV